MLHVVPPRNRKNATASATGLYLVARAASSWRWRGTLGAARKSARIAEVIGFGLALILIAELGWAAKDFVPSFADTPKSIAPPARGKLERARIDAKVQEILDRPLFTSGRMPPPPPPSPEQLAALQRPVLKSRLSGIAMVTGANRALFVTSDAKYVWIPEDGEIDGFKVSSILFDRVVLSSPFGQQVLLPSRKTPELVRNTKPVELGNFEPDKPDSGGKKIERR